MTLINFVKWCFFAPLFCYFRDNWWHKKPGSARNFVFSLFVRRRATESKLSLFIHADVRHTHSGKKQSNRQIYTRIHETAINKYEIHMLEGLRLVSLNNFFVDEVLPFFHSFAPCRCCFLFSCSCLGIYWCFLLFIRCESLFQLIIICMTVHMCVSLTLTTKQIAFSHTVAMSAVVWCVWVSVPRVSTNALRFVDAMNCQKMKQQQQYNEYK